jgi:PncC family amidohydrolase
VSQEATQELIDALRERGLRLATVESCTGGLMGAAITEIAGASDIYLGGWVTYANWLKTELVDVPADLLGPGGPGAVSGEVAEAMAEGGLERSGADWCVSITGIAGPGGGAAEKPVGTVWLGLASAEGARSRRMQFTGGREEIRVAAVAAALRWALEEVLRAGGSAGS